MIRGFAFVIALLAVPLISAVPASASGAPRTVVYTPGDSITAGSALTGGPAGAWPAQAETLLGRPGMFRNVARVGQCLAYAEAFCAVQPTLIDTFKATVLDATPRPAAAIVAIGHNDLTHLTDAQYKAAYLYLYRQAAAAHVRVVFATIPPLGQRSPLYGIAEWQRLRVNDWMRHTFGPAGYVDFDWALRERGHTWINPAYDAGDGVHPNVLGESVLASLIPKLHLRVDPSVLRPTPMH